LAREDSQANTLLWATTAVTAIPCLAVLKAECARGGGK
jgi:hypothetical protein